MRIVGEAIRFYRTREGFTQEKLAEKSALHFKYIGLVERGGANVSLNALRRIATALKVDLKELVRDG